MAEDALVSVGKVVGTHGIKGYLKVISYAESTAPFEDGGQLSLRQTGKPVAKFRIESARPHKRGLLLALEGITSVDVAKEWVGCELCVDRAALPETEQDTYYWHQIIGLDVFTVDGRRLGQVTAIFPTGSNDVYVVREGKKEILIPALASVVVEIDLTTKALRVDLPEGLES
jgi:16S rRNA processing protein RimM